MSLAFSRVMLLVKSSLNFFFKLRSSCRREVLTVSLSHIFALVSVYLTGSTPALNLLESVFCALCFRKRPHPNFYWLLLIHHEYEQYHMLSTFFAEEVLIWHLEPGLIENVSFSLMLPLRLIHLPISTLFLTVTSPKVSTTRTIFWVHQCLELHKASTISFLQ